MARFARLVVGLCSLIGLAAAQGGPPDPNNYFVYPPRGGESINENATVYSANINITYGVPSRQSFEWRTNYTDGLTVLLYQEGPPDMVQYTALVECGSDESFFGSVYWDGDLGDIDINNGTVAFLITYQCDGLTSSGVPFFFSHYFNLTAPVTATSSTATPTATSTSTSAANTDPGTTGTSVPANANADNQEGGGSSNAAALGGGIGGGIGGVLLLVAIVLFFVYKRRQRKNANPQTPSGFTPVSQVQNNGYFPPMGAVGSGPNSAYQDQNYTPIKYDPQHPPPRAELGGDQAQGGTYGYYDGREYKQQQQQSPSGRAELG